MVKQKHNPVLPQSRYLLLLLFTLLTLFPSCSPLKKVAPPPAPVVMYNPGKTLLHPEFIVYHNRDTQSTLYFRIWLRELIFSQANPELTDRAELRLITTLYSSYTDHEISARDTQQFLIYRDKPGEAYTGSQAIPTEQGKTYLLEVVLEDKIRKAQAREFIWIDRFSEFPQQDYLILQQPDNSPGFESFFYPSESFRILHRNYRGGLLYTSYFPLSRMLPAPPFSTDEQVTVPPVPDSTWSQTYFPGMLFRLPKKGRYVFHFKEQPVKGLCLLQLGEHFPQITTPEDMLPPLQYITTRNEYRSILKEPDLKLAVDRFWLQKGRTYPNARDLIRIFYNRVLFANHYFTSDREGWKTDRGMIYVIMGPPEEVVRNETSEQWVYKSPEANLKHVFKFTLRNNFLGRYDFILNRSEDYRVIWQMAVDSWRKGKIFSL